MQTSNVRRPRPAKIWSQAVVMPSRPAFGTRQTFGQFAFYQAIRRVDMVPTSIASRHLNSVSGSGASGRRSMGSLSKRLRHLSPSVNLRNPADLCTVPSGGRRQVLMKTIPIYLLTWNTWGLRTCLDNTLYPPSGTPFDQIEQRMTDWGNEPR